MIAVLIPCYSESKTIEKGYRWLGKSFPEATIYVYNNNSSDGTDITAKNPEAIVWYEYQQGKENVVRRIFPEIDIVVEMIEKILKYNVDMVVGTQLSSTNFTKSKHYFIIGAFGYI